MTTKKDPDDLVPDHVLDPRIPAPDLRRIEVTQGMLDHLTADCRRLEWLVQNKRYIEKYNGGYSVWSPSEKCLNKGMTFIRWRDAIDAAMTNAQEKERKHMMGDNMVPSDLRILVSQRDSLYIENQRLQSIFDRLRWTPCSEAMPPEGELYLTREDEDISNAQVMWLCPEDKLFLPRGRGDTQTPDEHVEWHPLPGTALWDEVMRDGN